MYECDFIPARYHEARRLSRALRNRAGLLVAMVAIMAVWWLAHLQRLAAADAMIQEVQRQSDQIRLDLAKRMSMEAEKHRLVEQRAVLMELQPPVRLLPLLSDISARLPKSVVLTELRVVSPSIARFARAHRGPAGAVDPVLGLPAVQPGATSEQMVATPTGQSSEQKPAGGAASGVQDIPSRPRLWLRGVAPSSPKIAETVALLESSPLILRIQTELGGSCEWGGRRAEKFVLICDLVPHRNELK